MTCNVVLILTVSHIKENKMLSFETPETQRTDCAQIKSVKIFNVADISVPGFAAPIIQVHIEKGTQDAGSFQKYGELVLNIGAPDSVSLLKEFEEIQRALFQHLQSNGFLPPGSITI